MKFLICLSLLALSGCIPIRSGGKTYYVIVGAGVIRVSQTNQVTVVKADSLGFFTGDGNATLGIANVYSARVPTNANVVIEVTK